MKHCQMYPNTQKFENSFYNFYNIILFINLVIFYFIYIILYQDDEEFILGR